MITATPREAVIFHLITVKTFGTQPHILEAMIGDQVQKSKIRTMMREEEEDLFPH
jgi:hypothetical protein